MTILDGIGSTEICHIFISNQPDAIRPGSQRQARAPATSRRSSTTTTSPSRRARSATCWCSGDSTCAMYWNKHDKTKDTIEGHWIRTGDKYWQDADGFFWYAGRGDDMLKVGGIWVSPVEVENALIEHPSVLEAGVVGREDHDRWSSRWRTWCCAPGMSGYARAGRANCRTSCGARLAEYKRPRWVEFVPGAAEDGRRARHSASSCGNRRELAIVDLI